MKALLVLTALAALFPPTMTAQDYWRGEVGAGYTYRSYSLPVIQQPPSRIPMNGWNGRVDYSFAAHFGVALDVDWTSNNSNGAHTEIGTVMIGPQVYPLGHRKATLFGHALIGGGRYYFRYPCNCFGSQGESNHFSETAFTWTVGGGVDYAISPKVALRLVQFDYEQVNFDLTGFGRGPVPPQNNWKFSAAVLLHF